MGTLEGTPVMSYYHGVKVELVTKGQTKVFDVPILMSFVADIAIYRTFPARVFHVNTLACLGHLSVIYMGTLGAEFSLVPLHQLSLLFPPASLSIKLQTRRMLLHTSI